MLYSLAHFRFFNTFIYVLYLHVVLHRKLNYQNQNYSQNSALQNEQHDFCLIKCVKSNICRIEETYHIVVGVTSVFYSCQDVIVIIWKPFFPHQFANIFHWIKLRVAGLLVSCWWFEKLWPLLWRHCNDVDFKCIAKLMSDICARA